VLCIASGLTLEAHIQCGLCLIYMAQKHLKAHLNIPWSPCQVLYLVVVHEGLKRHRFDFVLISCSGLDRVALVNQVNHILIILNGQLHQIFG